MGGGAERTGRGAPWAIAAALAGAVLVVFGRAATFDFLNLDDDVYVTANPWVRGGLTPGSVRWAFTAFHSGHWHPLTWLSLMLDVELFGVRPGPMHAVNVLLHALATALLFAVLRAATGATGRSAAVAALFGLHPLRLESVAWVTERKDVLSALFWILAMGAYVRYARRPRLGRYAAVVAVLGLGLLAKPMLVTLPVVLLLLDVWPLGRVRGSAPAVPHRFATASLPALVVEKLPLLALAAAMSVVAAAAQRAAGATVSLEGLPVPARLANASWAYVVYLRKTLWPLDLAIFYPLAPVPPARAVLAAAALGAATLAALRCGRRAPYVAVGWLWWLVALLPVIGLVQIGGQAYADRFTYLPHVGLFLLAVWGAADLAAARGVAPHLRAAAAGGVVAVLAAATLAQIGHWRDSVTVFRRALAVTTGNYLAHNNLGVARAERGHAAAAARHYAEAVRLNPTWPEARNNLGNAFAARGAYARARAEFEAALAVRPDFPVALNNLATAYAYEGDFARAIPPYERAVALDPGYFDARFALADALERTGRRAEAAAHYRVLLAARPGWTEGARRLARLDAIKD